MELAATAQQKLTNLKTTFVSACLGAKFDKVTELCATNSIS